MKNKAVNKWFEPGEKKLNWSKSDGQTRRRENALKARNGNLLKAARALRALANVTVDAETRRKAAADAKYFYKMYHRQKENDKRNNRL